MQLIIYEMWIYVCMYVFMYGCACMQFCESSKETIMYAGGVHQWMHSAWNYTSFESSILVLFCFLIPT